MTRLLTLSWDFMKQCFSVSKENLAACCKSACVARERLDILWKGQHTLNLSRDMQGTCKSM